MDPDHDPGPPDVSVVLVNYNASDLLRQALRSLCRPTHLRVETIVVDNASRDFVPQALLRDFPGVRVIRNEDNVGYARANNQGLHVARGSFALVMNPDITLPAGTLDALHAAAVAAPDAGIIAPALIQPDGSEQRNHFPLQHWSLRHRCLRQIGLSRYAGQYGRSESVSSDRDETTVVDAPYVNGACILVRREAISDVGPLDERFFLFAEDHEWCERMRAGGWRVLVCPGVRVRHEWGASMATVDAGPSAPVAVEQVRATYQFLRKKRGRWAGMYPAFVLAGSLARYAGSLVLTGPLWRNERRVALPRAWWALTGRGGISTRAQERGGPGRRPPSAQGHRGVGGRSEVPKHAPERADTVHRPQAHHPS